MSPTILVTGASGTIGRELVAQLQAAQADVVAGSSSGKTVANLTTRHVDFAAPGTLVEAFQGIDTLFLLLPLQANMLELARNVIGAAKTAGVRHIVRSSGAGADAASPVAIARVHGQVDQLLAESGLAYTLTRPTSFMQNYVNFYGGMIRGGALYLPQGEGTVPFIDTRDIAAVNAAILQSPARHAGQAYTLTGDAALSNAQVAAAIGAALGRRIDYVAVSDDAAVGSMREAGMDAWSIDALMSLNRNIAAGDAAEISPDVNRLLGRAPIGFAQFVADNLAAWRD